MPNHSGASAPAPSVVAETVWGSVGATGAIQGGSGNFTTSVTGGVLRVTFNRTFRTAPSVLVIPESDGSRRFIQCTASTRFAEFRWVDTASPAVGGPNASVPTDFYFVAVGT